MGFSYSLVIFQKQARVAHSENYPEAVQFRPAITPPSTSQIAPVTQLDSSLSRKFIALATSFDVPIRPIG